MRALLPVLLGEEAGFRVTRFEDGGDVVGAEGGEGAEDAGVDEVDQGVEFLKGGGREGGREGRGSVDGRVILSFPPSLPPSLLTSKSFCTGVPVRLNRARAGQAASAAKVLLPPSFNRCASSHTNSPICWHLFKVAE
jgi:hypothetical protein